MERIEINEALANRYKICYETKKIYWYEKCNQLVKEYFVIVEFKEIDIAEIDNLQSVFQKIPILNGKIVLIRLEIVDAEVSLCWGKKNTKFEVLCWNIRFDGSGNGDGYGYEDLCIEDEDGYKYETINHSLLKYCPLFENKYNLFVGANNPIRTFMFLLPKEDSKLYIGLNNIAGKLSISND